MSSKAQLPKEDNRINKDHHNVAKRMMKTMMKKKRKNIITDVHPDLTKMTMTKKTMTKKTMTRRKASTRDPQEVMVVKAERSVRADKVAKIDHKEARREDKAAKMDHREARMADKAAKVDDKEVKVDHNDLLKKETMGAWTSKVEETTEFEL